MIWLAAPWAATAADILQAQSGDAGWWLRTAGAESCVQDRAGERMACWEFAGRLTDLRETADGWLAAGRGADRSGGGLALFRGPGREGIVESLAVPESSGVPRGRPTLVTDDLRLLGLVWLEGATQETLAVRAAQWLGKGWSEPVTVSPALTGSQVAPEVTVLGDGRWLLVWTAFDGHDDETVWSVFDRGRWSVPAPVHEDNATPDILPAVVATGEGALAAWSWLDGRDYRLRTAFFDGREWRVDPATGGRGALEARLLATGGTYLLSFESVVPEQWVAWELDARGHVLRRAAIERTGRVERPLVEFLGAGVGFRWPMDSGLRETVAPWETGR